MSEFKMLPTNKIECLGCKKRTRSIDTVNFREGEEVNYFCVRCIGIALKNAPQQIEDLTTENARLKGELERLNAALYMACQRTIDPCPALPCNACSGFYEAGSEGAGEACTRGKMDYFILQASNRILKGGGDETM